MRRSKGSSRGGARGHHAEAQGAIMRRRKGPSCGGARGHHAEGQRVIMRRRKGSSCEGARGHHAEAQGAIILAVLELLASNSTTAPSNKMYIFQQQKIHNLYGYSISSVYFTIICSTVST
jgi:hypothetical protein